MTVLHDTDGLAAGLTPVQIADPPAASSGLSCRGALIARVEPAPGVALTLITCHLKSKLLSYPNGRFSPKDEGERARYGAYALYRR